MHAYYDVWRAGIKPDIVGFMGYRKHINFRDSHMSGWEFVPPHIFYQYQDWLYKWDGGTIEDMLRKYDIILTPSFSLQEQGGLADDFCRSRSPQDWIEFKRVLSKFDDDWDWDIKHVTSHWFVCPWWVFDEFMQLLVGSLSGARPVHKILRRTRQHSLRDSSVGFSDRTVLHPVASKTLGSPNKNVPIDDIVGRPVKPVILIHTTPAEAEINTAIRRTWVDSWGHLIPHFFMYDETLHGIVLEDEWRFPVPPGYWVMMNKTKAACAYALTQGYTHAFVICSDTYVVVPRLLSSGFSAIIIRAPRR